MKRSMLARVNAYLSLRRQFGYQLRSEGALLLDFARFADRRGHGGPPRTALMLRWAKQSRRRQRSTWARRLKVVRGFAQYWQGVEPSTQVPPCHIFGPRPGRPTPFLYRPAQIRLLLRRAHKLPGRLRAPTYATLLGLLACTGLRISEALGLRVQDVDLAGALLCVRESKYHKVRWIPLHRTALEPLRQYARRRQRLWPHAQHFFVATDGGPLTRQAVESVFSRLRYGFSDSRVPRLHDLRHTMASQVLLRWQDQKQGAVNRLALLAHYLGHNRIADTYWYLQAFPALLAQASRRFLPGP